MTFIFKNLISFLRLILRKIKFLQPIVHNIKLAHNKFAWKYLPFLWPYAKSSKIQDIFDYELKEPNTKLLINILFKKYKSSNLKKAICELGCNKGQKLYAISKSFPKFDYYGYDINKGFINAGNNFLSKRVKVDNIRLYHKDIDSNQLIYESDITFTSLTLMYINPKRIEKLISQIANNSKDGFIFQELVAKLDASSSSGYTHNYYKIFSSLNLFAKFDIEFQKILDSDSDKAESYLICIIALRKN